MFQFLRKQARVMKVRPNNTRPALEELERRDVPAMHAAPAALAVGLGPAPLAVLAAPAGQLIGPPTGVAATQGNPNGAAGEIPAFFDGRSVTINVNQLSDTSAASIIAHNKNPGPFSFGCQRALFRRGAQNGRPPGPPGSACRYGRPCPPEFRRSSSVPWHTDRSRGRRLVVLGTFAGCADRFGLHDRCRLVDESPKGSSPALAGKTSPNRTHLWSGRQRAALFPARRCPGQ